MPNIAVIIAHKDYNHYLKDALESCKKQTYPNYVCVIDDGSKTLPLDIMKEVFGKPEERNGKFYYSNKAVLIPSDGQGPSHARNLGLTECKGFDAFLVLDADDYIYPTKIEKMIEVLKDPNIGVVYADYHVFDTIKGNTAMEFKHPYDVFLLNDSCIVHSGSMISAKFLDKVKINENEWYKNSLRVAEDYNLWLRLSKECLFYHIPEFLGCSRSHQQDSTHSVSSEIWNECMSKVKQ